MATLDKTALISVDVEENFTDQIKLIADSQTSGVPPNEITEYESLEFVSLSADQDISELSSFASQDNNDLVITISGNHKLELFDQNEIKAITRGSSDKLEDPIITDSFDDLNPDDQQVFSFIIDQRLSITVNFELEYISTFQGLSSLETANFTQVVSNDWDRYIPTFLTFI